MKKRRFSYDALIHCYHNTVDGVLLFYSVSDYLVFFSIACIAARRYNVNIVKLCPMPDHYHISCFCECSSDLAAFIRYLTSVYAREFNTICIRKGQLFTKSFGSAPKRTDKAIRTNLIYVDNNPVERHLSQKAEDYQWNFLKYAESDHPFSDKIIKRTASSHLKNAMRMIESFNKKGRFLRHSTLNMLFSKLDLQEKKSLTDFIITTYSVIDYQFSVEMFGSHKNNLVADNASTGSEYEIRERFNGKRDDVYAKMTGLLLRGGFVSDIHDVISMSLENKKKLFYYLKGMTDATSRQIECFLHLPPQS
ncbi:MAG: transposase [Bacteroidales bacterium]|nr:transposase [Bacteroidales bacterium]